MTYYIFSFATRGRCLRKSNFMRISGGYDYISDAKNLTSFMRKLRKKSEPFPDSPQYVLTDWGVGYKFNEEKA